MIEIPARNGRAARVPPGPDGKGHQHGRTAGRRYLGLQRRGYQGVHVDGAQPGGVSVASFRGRATSLVTNKRRSILTIVKDSSAGIHDTLIRGLRPLSIRAARLPRVSRQLHRQLASELAALGLTPPETPAPLNLWMNIPVLDGDRVDFLPPVSTPGSAACAMRAEPDCIIAFSACPQDLLPINGLAMQPTEAHFEVLD